MLLVLAALVCVEYIYVCIVVLGAHLVLSVLGTCHMCRVYVCIVVLGVHLVLSVLAALVVCVGYM